MSIRGFRNLFLGLVSIRGFAAETDRPVNGQNAGDRGFCCYFGGFAGLWPSDTRFVLAFFPQFDSSEPTNTCTYGENSSLILAGRALHFGPDSIGLHD